MGGDYYLCREAAYRVGAPRGASLFLPSYLWSLQCFLFFTPSVFVLNFPCSAIRYIKIDFNFPTQLLHLPTYPTSYPVIPVYQIPHNANVCFLLLQKVKHLMASGKYLNPIILQRLRAKFLILAITRGPF